MGTQFSNSEKAPKFEENDPPPRYQKAGYTGLSCRRWRRQHNGRQL